MRNLMAMAIILICVAAGAQDDSQAWLLNADADGDGVADGWASNSDAGEAEFTVAQGAAGDNVQTVVGKAREDGIYRRIEGLDPQATYLLTAGVKINSGGVTWGPEGVKSKYLHGYGKLVESRISFTGHDSVTVVFYTLVPEAIFEVSRLELSRVQPEKLPIEEQTGLYLIPRPLMLEEGAGEGLKLAAETTMAFVGLDRGEVNPELFREDLGLPEGALADAAVADADIVLCALESLPVLAERRPDLGRDGIRDGYRLIVSDKGAIILAKGPAHAFYGLMTLRQLCVPDGSGGYRVPPVTIRDWPAMGLRGTYQSGAMPSRDNLERARYLARMKMNAVVMEDSVFYHLDEGDNLAKVRGYFDYLRSLHIEPIPLVQSFGWGFMVLSVDPQCVEAHYAQDREMVFIARDRLPADLEGDIPEGNPELLATTGALTTIEQPLENPGLEPAADGDLPGWTSDRWEQQDGAGLDTEVSSEGAASLRLNRDTYGIIRTFQDFELPANVTARFTCDIKTQDLTGTAYMEVYRITEAGELVGGPAVMGPRAEGTRDWQPVSMSLSTGEHPYYRIYLRIQDGTGTAWFDNLRVRASHEVLRNLVHVEDSLEVKSPEGTPYERGKDYEVIAGETKFPFEWEAKPWWIVRLPEGEIPAGGEVLVSYEYAPAGAITYCPTDPRTQGIMRKALADTATKLGVSRIHIGHDEPRWLNTCKACKARGLSNAELLSDELKRMNDFVKSANPDVRVMMWADALNPFHNAPYQQLEPANETTPKDIIQCVWFYDARDDIVEGRSLAYFREKGYQTTGSPWFDPENTWDWARECASAEGCLGLIYTSWGDTNRDPWAALPLAAAFSWNPDDPAAPEAVPWDAAEVNRCWGVLQRVGE